MRDVIHSETTDAHVFRCDLFVRYRLCRRDLVLASRQARARWPHGASTEVSDFVRRQRGDPAQVAALRSCAVLVSAESEAPAHADPAPSLDPTKLSIRPPLRLTILCRMDLGGDAMDHDTIAPCARQQRHAAGPRPANEAMTPYIKKIVSKWYIDELGNQSRIIKARD